MARLLLISRAWRTHGSWMDEYSGWISWLMTLQARCQGAKQTTTQVFAGRRAPGLQRTPTYVQTESQHRIQDSGISIEQTTCSHLHHLSSRQTTVLQTPITLPSSMAVAGRLISSLSCTHMAVVCDAFSCSHASAAFHFTAAET